MDDDELAWACVEQRRYDRWRGAGVLFCSVPVPTPPVAACMLGGVCMSGVMSDAVPVNMK